MEILNVGSHVEQRQAVGQQTRGSNNPDALRLLAHNPKAKILWSHMGWDNTGHRTAALTARLLEKHPNLYMSFKISPKDSLAETRPIEI